MNTIMYADVYQKKEGGPFLDQSLRISFTNKNIISGERVMKHN